MKIYLKIFFITFFALFILIGCEEESPNEPPEQNYPDYYPSGIGSVYKYSVTETDSFGNVVQAGTRNILYSGTYTFRERDYTKQEDTLDFGSQSDVNTFLFRKTDTGVFYAIDTAQISLLVPDTLKQFVNLREEMQLLFYPLTNGSSWSMYRLTAQVQPGIEVKILDIIAAYELTEQIDLNWNSGRVGVTAQKVKYTFEIYDEVGAEPERYIAYMWFVENIGLVKFQGNQFILDFSGGAIGINITDNILSQEITEYYPAEN